VIWLTDMQRPARLNWMGLAIAHQELRNAERAGKGWLTCRFSDNFDSLEV
jgi:hypothetical protein